MSFVKRYDSGRWVKRYDSGRWVGPARRPARTATRRPHNPASVAAPAVFSKRGASGARPRTCSFSGTCALSVLGGWLVFGSSLATVAALGLRAPFDHGGCGIEIRICVWLSRRFRVIANRVTCGGLHPRFEITAVASGLPSPSESSSLRHCRAAANSTSRLRRERSPRRPFG